MVAGNSKYLLSLNYMPTTKLSKYSQGFYTQSYNSPTGVKKKKNSQNKVLKFYK